MALAARATRNRTIERYNRNEMMDRRRICLLLVLWMSPAHADEIRQLRLATNDLVYDRFTRRIYASVPSSAGSGGTRSIRLRVALPDGIRAGGKYLIAVLDAENAVQEADEGNNVIVFGPIR
jgi:hypothetical protein